MYGDNDFLSDKKYFFRSYIFADYSQRRNIWQKVKKAGETRQEQITLVKFSLLPKIKFWKRDWALACFPTDFLSIS